MTHAILEPLTEATKQEIDPIRVPEDTFLMLKLEDGKFEARVRKCRPARLEDLAGNRSIFLDAKAKKFVLLKESVMSNAGKILFRRIPESHWYGSKDYNRANDFWFGATDYTAIVVSSCWPADQVLFDNEETRLHYLFLLKRFIGQSRRAELVAKFKLEGEVPNVDIVDQKDRPLSDYQRVGVRFSQLAEGSALFMDKGTGKTATSIGFLCSEFRQTFIDDGKMARVLIIVPNQVRLNWQREIARFTTLPGKVTIIRGGAVARVKQLRDVIRTDKGMAFSVAIIGWDTLPTCVDALERIPWDLCICDEVHYAKSPKTRRFKSLLRIREMCERRLILTGTPVANTIMDLYSQLEFLGEGMSGFTSFDTFRRFHGKYIKQKTDEGHHVSKLVGYQNIPLLQERLARCSYSLTKEEAALGLPDKVYDTYEVEMGEQQAEIYRRLAREMVVEFESALGAAENKSLVANHVLTQLLRLAQITSGHVKWNAVYDPDTGECLREERIECLEPNPKIQAVRDIIADADPKSKVIVWAIFTQDIQSIEEALKEDGIKCGAYYGSTSQADREEYEWAFNNDPEFRVLIANPATAGEGLNLIGYNPDSEEQDTYCGNVIFFSCDWSFVKRSQAEDRAHRRGTKMPVAITDLVVPGTIDEEIRTRVEQKKTAADLVTDIRDILNHILEFSS